jgi:hypothetical protein
MTPEQLEKFTKEFTKMVRDYLRIQAEAMALELIIRSSVVTKDPIPELWLEALNHIRTTPKYRNIAEQLDPQLAQLDAASDWSELVRVLGTIPPPTFVN